MAKAKPESKKPKKVETPIVKKRVRGKGVFRRKRKPSMVIQF